VEQGANVILVSPYYRHSVFYDMQKINKLKVVSDIQLYLDLSHYPLRGLEQAEHLYEKRIKPMIERGGAPVSLLICKVRSFLERGMFGQMYIHGRILASASIRPASTSGAVIDCSCFLYV
jgi:hypothetical protein